MIRRAFFGVAALAIVGAWSGAAEAGSYLDRAGILLEQARKEGDLLKSRSNDKEVVLLVKSLSEARMKVGRKMIVPANVASVHPHLLLVLENYERAAQSADSNNFKKMNESIAVARDEEKTFRDLLKQLGYTLPK